MVENVFLINEKEEAILELKNFKTKYKEMQEQHR